MPTSGDFQLHPGGFDFLRFQVDEAKLKTNTDTKIHQNTDEKKAKLYKNTDTNIHENTDEKKAKLYTITDTNIDENTDEKKVKLYTNNKYTR